MPNYDFTVTYTYSTADTLWAEDKTDALRQIEDFAYVVQNGIMYTWDYVNVEEIEEVD